MAFSWFTWFKATDKVGLDSLQFDYMRAHKHCMENRAEIEASVLCGCFYCMSIYPPSDIVDWIDDKESLTADCPRCGIDAVIGSASGFPITSEFLNLMNEHRFEGHRSGTHV
jgi:hypothetical protein